MNDDLDQKITEVIEASKELGQILKTAWPVIVVPFLVGLVTGYLVA